MLNLLTRSPVLLLCFGCPSFTAGALPSNSIQVITLFYALLFHPRKTEKDGKEEGRKERGSKREREREKERERERRNRIFYFKSSHRSTFAFRVRTCLFIRKGRHLFQAGVKRTSV